MGAVILPANNSKKLLMNKLDINLNRPLYLYNCTIEIKKKKKPKDVGEFGNITTVAGRHEQSLDMHAEKLMV